MSSTNQFTDFKDVYDDDDIPEVDLPKGQNQAEPENPLSKSTKAKQTSGKAD